MPWRGAKAADTEIAAGNYRGVLHGIPDGVKDLLDTKDLATTYGAELFRDRSAPRWKKCARSS